MSDSPANGVADLSPRSWLKTFWQFFKHAAGNPPATASLEGHIRGVWRLASVTPSPLLYCSGVKAFEVFFFFFLAIV